ncbi:MAG: hypothetical protein NVSMB19_09730 [Vulcanimicrobiaceae bacterium]
MSLGLLGSPACTAGPAASSTYGTYPSDAEIRLEALEDRALSWRVPLAARDLRGLRLLYDTPVPGGAALGVVRSAVRANHRLDPFDALVFTTRAIELARRHRLRYEFVAATLLQESGFNPAAMSPAGAIGIAQFTLETADIEGVDPFDWADAMRGSAALLGRYVRAYDGRYPDPYAATMAAYNAGPGVVARYGGIPPYPETVDYIGDIYDRWSRIDRDATGGRRRPR